MLSLMADVPTVIMVHNCECGLRVTVFAEHGKATTIFLTCECGRRKTLYTNGYATWT